MEATASKVARWRRSAGLFDWRRLHTSAKQSGREDGMGFVDDGFVLDGRRKGRRPGGSASRILATSISLSLDLGATIAQFVAMKGSLRLWHYSLPLLIRKEESKE